MTTYSGVYPVKVYVKQKLVASHIRSHTYGYTTVREHLASSYRVIMERSAAYYVEKAKDISPDCHEYVKRIFDPKRTAQPEEVYYKLCNSIVSLRRKYAPATFDLTCRQCMEYGIYSYRKKIIHIRIRHHYPKPFYFASIPSSAFRHGIGQLAGNRDV